MFFADAVEYGTYRIAQASTNKPQEPPERDSLNKRLEGKYYPPAHSHIAYHGEYLVFFYIDGSKSYCKCCQPPYDTEHYPAGNR